MEARQVQVWRRMSGEQRLRLGFDMSLLARNLTRSGIRQQHPEWTEREVWLQVLRCAFLPKDLPAWLR